MVALRLGDVAGVKRSRALSERRRDGNKGGSKQQCAFAHDQNLPIAKQKYAGDF
jgi:hypothetical protein